MKGVSLIAAVLLLCVSLVAQAPNDSFAPLPAPIRAAKTVFIANGGGFDSSTAEGLYHGGTDRPYEQFYRAVQSWGYYRIVDSPEQADIVLEIGCDSVYVGNGSTAGAIDKLRIAVSDTKTHTVLWSMSEYVRPAITIANRDKNFDLAMTTLVSRLKHLVDPKSHLVAPVG